MSSLSFWQTVGNQPQQQQPQKMVGVHGKARAETHFAKVARKHGLFDVCADSLEAITKNLSITNVPVIDHYQRMRQQVKCFQQKALVSGKNKQSDLQVSVRLFLICRGADLEVFFLLQMAHRMILISISTTNVKFCAICARQTVFTLFRPLLVFWGMIFLSFFTLLPFARRKH